MSPAEYCKQCPSFISHLGACPYPNKTVLWALIGLLPLAIACLFLLISAFTHKLRHVKVFIIMGLAYIFSDSLLKSIFRGVRPQGACKTSYGMPSSHMAMLCSFVMLRLKYSAYLWEKVVWVGVLIAEGVGRIQLNYHTLMQVLAGAAVGAIFFFAFECVWRQCESGIPFDQPQPAIEKGEEIQGLNDNQ